MDDADLSLRPTGDADLDFVVATERDPEASPFVTVRAREQHLEIVERDRGREHLIVEVAGEPAGFAIVAGLGRPHNNIEVGTYVIARRGEGLGRRALRLIVERCFAEHGAHRVWLDAVDHNDRARRAYEAVGFRQEGEMREAWRAPDGTYETLVVLSILDREWAELSRQAPRPGQV